MIKKFQAEEVFITEEMLQKRVRELGFKISEDYRGKDLVVISILKGAFYFVADLTRQISIPINIDFMAIGRFPGSGNGTGVVRITKDLDLSITGRHVLLVENIVNTGLTIGYLIKSLEPRRPASLNICTLLDNPYKRLVELPIKYSGFSIQDDFLVGYGLDFEENFRHLPYIARLE